MRERYVVTDLGTILVGDIVGRNAVGMKIYELDGPLTVRERLEGLDADRWSGGTFTYRRHDCEPGRLLLDLESSPAIHPRAFRVDVRQHGQLTERLRFRSREQYPSREIDLVPREGRCELELRIPTGFAGAATEGDLRQLGLRFRQVRYVPR